MYKRKKMFLTSVDVSKFKSINTQQIVKIDDEVTVFVGMNESGKTVFLKALEKSNDAQGLAKFHVTSDYPRKDLAKYKKQHSQHPHIATVLTYYLNDDELNDLNAELNTDLTSEFTFSLTHLYDNSTSICIDVDELPIIKTLLSQANLSTDVKDKLVTAKSIRSIPKLFEDASCTEEDTEFLNAINKRIKKAGGWDSVMELEVWKWLEPKLPQFLYFSDYDILPSKINIPDLANRVKQAENDPEQLQPSHRAILALLRIADIEIDDIENPSEGYEELKSQIESVSISLTDQIMKFWKQNEDIEVEIDIKVDPQDDAPYNTGSNLYLRIKSLRHKVGTPFDQRSRGFIWFFSFLTWFDSVQEQIGSDKDIILLLDEPALALHALAQKDFLDYIDDLSGKHQVLYTTHSPFMVHSERLHQVRMVEDRCKIGTIISDNLSGTDSRTIFPLQAALGWTVAQNLFIAQKNLLVEGASDLIYLKALSSHLESKDMTGLRDDITIVPVGGLDNVVTFIALLGANGLKIAVLHDYSGRPEQKLEEIIKGKIINSKVIFNASQFRDLTKIGEDVQASDTEDLFDPIFYLDYFNKTFSAQLKGITINESDLPSRPRIVSRIEVYLKDKDITLRSSGGFNHYAVSSYFASNPPDSLDDMTLKRFEELFKAINKAVK